MGKRRDRLKVIYDVLDLCQRPQRRTYIIRLANLPGSMVTRHFPLLEKKGLLAKKTVAPRSRARKPYNTWETTDKGTAFMKQIEELMEIIAV